MSRAEEQCPLEEQRHIWPARLASNTVIQTCDHSPWRCSVMVCLLEGLACVRSISRRTAKRYGLESTDVMGLIHEGQAGYQPPACRVWALGCHKPCGSQTQRASSDNPAADCITMTLAIFRHSSRAAGLAHGMGWGPLWGDRALGVRVNWEAGRL